ncbi:MAG: trypsin-like peptidase domain-containing protein [Oscillospiraceae bacterium]|jgi:serine protease Do|nr:trypsin-like peptidase domain-containing protein [Oscillospiraceae bacterium]
MSSFDFYDEYESLNGSENTNTPPQEPDSVPQTEYPPLPDVSAYSAYRAELEPAEPTQDGEPPVYGAAEQLYGNPAPWDSAALSGTGDGGFPDEPIVRVIPDIPASAIPERKTVDYTGAFRDTASVYSPQNAAAEEPPVAAPFVAEAPEKTPEPEEYSAPYTQGAGVPQRQFTPYSTGTNRSYFAQPNTPPAPPPREPVNYGGSGGNGGNNNGRRPKFGFFRTVAVIIVCVILSSFGTYGLIWAEREGYIDVFPTSAVSELPPAIPSQTPLDTPTPLPAETPVTITTPKADGTGITPEEIYENACKFVVSVSSELTSTTYWGTEQGTVYGSGFIISEDGYILTNYHVIENASQNDSEVVVTMNDGSEYTAKIVGYEKDNDVAVLKIEAKGLPFASIGNSDLLTVGNQVYVVGNPQMLNYTMTEGIVSALNRQITISSDITINMFQTSAAVNSGNSGGPIFNSRGDVVGIVSAKYKETGVEGLGFAIPINDAMAITNELITKGHVTGKASLGIEATTVDKQAALYYNMVEGAFVNKINSGSAAEKAGIQQGDIITQLGDAPVTSSETLIAAKKKFQAGDSTKIVINRQGREITLTIVFDEAQS